MFFYLPLSHFSLSFSLSLFQVSSTKRAHGGKYVFYLLTNVLIAAVETQKGWFHSRIERTFAYSLSLNDAEAMDLEEVSFFFFFIIFFFLFFFFCCCSNFPFSFFFFSWFLFLTLLFLSFPFLSLLSFFNLGKYVPSCSRWSRSC